MSSSGFREWPRIVEQGLYGLSPHFLLDVFLLFGICLLKGRTKGGGGRGV